MPYEYYKESSFNFATRRYEMATVSRYVPAPKVDYGAFADSVATMTKKQREVACKLLTGLNFGGLGVMCLGIVALEGVVAVGMGVCGLALVGTAVGVQFVDLKPYMADNPKVKEN